MKGCLLGVVLGVALWVTMVLAVRANGWAVTGACAALGTVWGVVRARRGRRTPR